MGRLTGKVALVTGASGGIGKGCALELARDGADVVVNYNTHPDWAAEVVREIEEMGSRAIAYRADQSDRSQVQAMVRDTVKEFGHLDVLVANAYRATHLPFLEVTPEALHKTLSVTLVGTFWSCQEAAKAMVDAGKGGSIVIISTIHTEHAYPGAVQYNMAKFGVMGMGLTMANELIPHGIRVNLVNPGWIDTPGERLHSTEEELQQIASTLPLKRLGKPSEIGKVVSFLASDDASFVIGSIWKADGGEIINLHNG
jgi:glucose 1-dehydrogenase